MWIVRRANGSLGTELMSSKGQTTFTLRANLLIDQRKPGHQVKELKLSNTLIILGLKGRWKEGILKDGPQVIEPK